WLSYVSLEPARRSPTALTETYGHRVLATPQQPWEALKIGAGPPPLRTPLGWLVIYHGVCGRYPTRTLVRPALSYSAGVLVLDGDDVLTTRYRSPQPILAPELEVLADEITRSWLHVAGRDGGRGYALRFPRLVGFREADKRPEDATTMAEIIALYNQQGGSAAPG